jgi:hypothetical protein
LFDVKEEENSMAKVHCVEEGKLTCGKETTKKVIKIRIPN